MRSLVMLSLIAFSACASSGTGASARPETVRIVGGTGGVTQLSTVAEDRPNITRFHAPPDHVWRALPGIYEAIAIPVGQSDAATHTIGNPSFRMRRQLGNVPLSRYFDCGRTQGGPSADSYELHLSVLTQVQQGEGAGSIVSTSIQAMAKPVSFAGDFVRCSSKGALEARIVELLKARVQG